MAEINASMVKQLRDRTGAGMMDCKNALVEASGDEEKAVEIIQKKGLAKAAKKAGAIAAEGVVHAYMHPGGRLGVLVEVNSQTDFVARSTEFLDFVELVGLQIASMAPEYVRREDISAEDKERQNRLYVAQLDEEEAKTGKKRPDVARAKILEGKLDKWMSEKCLEEQASIRDHDEGKTIKSLSDALTAKIGEKIAVRRFVRFELGEGIAKVKADLAADVAALVKG